jgi:hypothetical protein
MMYGQAQGVSARSRRTAVWDIRKMIVDNYSANLAITNGALSFRLWEIVGEQPRIQRQDCHRDYGEQ